VHVNTSLCQHVVAVGAGEDADVIADYFNLRVNLTERAAAWAACDKRYHEIAPFIFGARMLRQDPVECLFEFICSSNNHISRIGSMVDHLCRAYGSALCIDAGVALSWAAGAWATLVWQNGAKGCKLLELLFVVHACLIRQWSSQWPCVRQPSKSG
jgi:intraflagellar transport protein 122